MNWLSGITQARILASVDLAIGLGLEGWGVRETHSSELDLLLFLLEFFRDVCSLKWILFPPVFLIWSDRGKERILAFDLRSLQSLLGILEHIRVQRGRFAINFND